jgi:hypothetical protein
VPLCGRRRPQLPLWDVNQHVVCHRTQGGRRGRGHQGQNADSDFLVGRWRGLIGVRAPFLLNKLQYLALRVLYRAGQQLERVGHSAVVEARGRDQLLLHPPYG